MRYVLSMGLALVVGLSVPGGFALADPTKTNLGNWHAPDGTQPAPVDRKGYIDHIANIYIQSDARFEELIDRLTVKHLADTGERAYYSWMLLEGYFDGNAEDYAREAAVLWLQHSVWPENAAVYDPDNTTNADAILKQWSAVEADPKLTEAAGLRCDWRWTEHQTIAALAEQFGGAVEDYLALTLSHPAYEAVFNPNSISFFNESGKTEFLRAAISSWLMQAGDPNAHPPGCMETVTNFDVWMEHKQKISAAAEPFSAGPSPE